MRFPLQYWPMHHRVVRTLKADPEKDFIKLLAACESTSGSHSNEVCLHNRFLFADFVLYYELAERYRPLGVSREAFELHISRTRDTLYEQWTNVLPAAKPTGYFEWEGADLRELSMEEFRAMGSDKFRKIERMSKWFNQRPPVRDSARTLVYETLQGRTPFSSIFPRPALQLAHTDRLGVALECSLHRLQEPGSGKHLFDVVSNCAGSEALALQVIAVLATQRMYLLRDWKCWVEQAFPPPESQSILRILALSSELHFRMETYGRAYGAHLLYPETLAVTGGSYKAYHFWSTAWLGYLLAEAGFDEHTAIREATRPARRYKRFIQVPGFTYNLLLMRPLLSGTTADYRKVLHEQEMGARWGYALYWRLH